MHGESLEINVRKITTLVAMHASRTYFSMLPSKSNPWLTYVGREFFHLVEPHELPVKRKRTYLDVQDTFLDGDSLKLLFPPKKARMEKCTLVAHNRSMPSKCVSQKRNGFIDNYQCYNMLLNFIL